MTVEDAHTVLALLSEDPQLRVYQYLHAQTRKVLYALFPKDQYNDMATAPNVAAATLLYDQGRYTEAGRAWRQAHEPTWDTPNEEAEMDTVFFKGKPYRLADESGICPTPIPDWFPDVFPVGWQEHPTHDGWDRAYNRVYRYRDTTTVLVSCARYGDGKHWLHVSVSRKNRELPSWELLSQVKDLFIGPARTALQVLPPRAKHVNIAPVLHLFCCLDGDVTPDFTGGGDTI